MKNYLSNAILIELLKKNGIKHLVLSSGARNIPFVNSVEVDSEFTCYSVVDERNAAFFGMGISQKLQEPVAIACTSGTAASNYLTGVTEAYYSNIPLLVITFDRSPYALNQLETQKIDQPAIFQSVCKKSVSLPVIKDNDDVWYCQRLVNEAMIALRQHSCGPVHINVPLEGDMNTLISGTSAQITSDEVKMIDYISMFNEEGWIEKAKRLGKSKKILLLMGQSLPPDDRTKKAIKKFTEITKCPILADNLCNFRCDNLVFSQAVGKALNNETFSCFLPDIVISFGLNFQERIKDLFKANRRKFEHWLIEPEGIVRDVFKSQTALFETSVVQFFEKMNTLLDNDSIENSKMYLESWKKLEDAAQLPEMQYSSFSAVKTFANKIPNNSLLHVAILNSTRLSQFFRFDESIEVYGNVNSFGIDGCLPTFMGQAFATDNLAFLVIGDLSFFYGMNAIAIKHRKNNIRILVMNNKGAAEFHIQPDSNEIPTIDLHIGCAHDRSVKGWAESMDYEYIMAEDTESLERGMENFVSANHEKPVIFEVFTDMKKDGEFVLHTYRELEKSIQPVLAEIEKN
ncbi:MAG: 2-succinyl-5-enolpyruvyl-6-hydroxy-3-cyclohexene-1-carboxylic-acid synthase [Lachnospiraceae bacterium]|nr:2-succinyl-5-enolpyruvyl-6-hydroxy-3-cyclohexene-1-carboxylic-acid synthase [Lachnospiraceae bacterium]